MFLIKVVVRNVYEQEQENEVYKKVIFKVENMKAEVKEKNGRKVYEPSGMLKDFLKKVGICFVCFMLGVMLTLMFYPIIRPMN